MRPVALAGQTLELTVPRQLWTRHAVQIAMGTASGPEVRIQVAAAALFLCAPDAQAKAGAPKYTRSEGLAEYGARVLDYLLGLGAPPTEVYAASTTAVMMVLESVPGQPEHEQALGNSGAPSEG
jgi:hypothetical protein